MVYNLTLTKVVQEYSDNLLSTVIRFRAIFVIPFKQKCTSFNKLLLRLHPR